MSPHRLTTLRRYKVPSDVLIAILEHLDPASLLRICKVFRRIYFLVLEYQPLLYYYELAITGMKDGPAPYSSRLAIGRLELLSDYKKDWPRLKWTHEYKMQVPTHSLVGVSGGFLHQIRNHGTQYTLELAELPSYRTNRPPARTRHITFITTPLENVGIDFAQELIVTSHVVSGQNEQVAVRLSFREFWKFGKHPRASSIAYDFCTQAPTRVANILICGGKLAVLLEFPGGKCKYLLMDWHTFSARWLDDQAVHFLNEMSLLVVKRNGGQPVLALYNISHVETVCVEREYELPGTWNNSVIGFSPNTSPLSDLLSSSSDALFYPDPATRVLLMTIRTPSTAVAPSSKLWLFINESYFRPSSTKDRRRVPWSYWSQYCIGRDMSSSAFIRGPCVIGSRVLYVDSDSTHGRNTGHANGCRSRLNVIDFAPFPDFVGRIGRRSRAWTLIGQKTALLPDEAIREIPPTTIDNLAVEDLRATEDNIVLFFGNRQGVMPVNVLTFGVPQPPRSRHEMHISTH